MRAVIEVYAANVSYKPISKYLFGKFLEHHGGGDLVGCIYHGIWAQILDNPSFEESQFFGVPLSTRAKYRYIAYRWKKFGSGNVTYSLEKDCVGSGTSQRISVFSLDTPRVGIQQSIYMPLHREDNYQLSLWVKGEAERLLITVETTTGDVLAEVIIDDIRQQWTKLSVNLTVNKGGVSRGQLLIFKLALDEPGYVMIDHCFLFPADNIEGFDPDVIKLLREMKPTIIRWPGGNFASQYHWKDGVGPVEDRPIRLNKAWNIVEYNYVGTDEFIKFCRLVGAEPLICVNAGDGTPEEAAQWVEYCNGDLNTTYGKLRAENGHPEPYNVTFWEIGNELYGSWQIGHCTAEQYAVRYERFYEAMTKVDPNIKLIANGGWDRTVMGNEWRYWDIALIERNGDKVRSLSRHYLIWVGPTGNDYLNAMAYPFWLRNHLNETREELKKYLSDPKIAITELQGARDLDLSQTLIEALFYSGIINTAINLDGFVEIITHSSLMWFGGGIRKEREIVFPTAAYYAQKLYATQPGRWPVRVKISTPMFNVLEVPPEVPAVKNAPYVDAVALLNDDRSVLSLIVTNFHPTEPIEATITLHNFTIKEPIKIKTLTGPNYLVRNTWSNPEAVKITESEIEASGEKLKYILPAHSITLFLFS